MKRKATRLNTLNRDVQTEEEEGLQQSKSSENLRSKAKKKRNLKSLESGRLSVFNKVPGLSDLDMRRKDEGSPSYHEKPVPISVSCKSAPPSALSLFTNELITTAAKSPDVPTPVLISDPFTPQAILTKPRTAMSLSRLNREIPVFPFLEARPKHTAFKRLQPSDFGKGAPIPDFSAWLSSFARSRLGSDVSALTPPVRPVPQEKAQKSPQDTSGTKQTRASSITRNQVDCYSIKYRPLLLPAKYIVKTTRTGVEKKTKPKALSAVTSSAKKEKMTNARLKERKKQYTPDSLNSWRTEHELREFDGF